MSKQETYHDETELSSESKAMTTSKWSWALIKENWKVIFYSIGACVSAMLWGFDIGMCIDLVALALADVYSCQFHLDSPTWLQAGFRVSIQRPASDSCPLECPVDGYDLTWHAFRRFDVRMGI